MARSISGRLWDPLVRGSSPGALQRHLIKRQRRNAASTAANATAASARASQNKCDFSFGFYIKGFFVSPEQIERGKMLNIFSRRLTAIYIHHTPLPVTVRPSLSSPLPSPLIYKQPLLLYTLDFFAANSSP